MGTQKPSGGPGKSGDIRAGGGFWELSLRDNFTKALDAIQGKIKRFGSMLSSAGGGMMKGGAALGAGPLGLLFGGGSRLAETAQLARQMEVPIAMMGKFQYAAERAGVSVEEVMNDTRGLYRDLLNKAPIIDPVEAESALKIQNDFKDSIRSLQDAMTPLLKVISPIVSQTSQWMQANAGLVQSVATIATGLVVFGAAAKVGGMALMAIGPAASLTFGVISTGVKVVSVLATGMWSLVKVLHAVKLGALIVSAAKLGWFAITTIVTGGLAGLKVALLAVFSPMGLLVGVVAACVAGFGYLVYKFLETTGVGNEIAAALGGLLGKFGELRTGVVEFANTAIDAWGGIVAAFMKGDLAAAAEVALAGISLEWLKAVAWWTDIWNRFKGTIVDGWDDVTTGIGSAFADAAESVGLVPGGTANELMKEHNRKRDANQAFRAKELEDARAAVAAAQKRFNGAVVIAKGGPVVAGPDNLTEEQKRFAEHGLRGALRAVTDEVKGTFSAASSLGQFGYGSKVSQETEIQKAIVANTKKTAEETAKLVTLLMLR